MFACARLLITYMYKVNIYKINYFVLTIFLIDIYPKFTAIIRDSNVTI